MNFNIIIPKKVNNETVFLIDSFNNEENSLSSSYYAKKKEKRFDKKNI